MKIFLKSFICPKRRDVYLNSTECSQGSSPWSVCRSGHSSRVWSSRAGQHIYWTWKEIINHCSTTILQSGLTCVDNRDPGSCRGWVELWETLLSRWSGPSPPTWLSTSFVREQRGREALPHSTHDNEIPWGQEPGQPTTGGNNQAIFSLGKLEILYLSWGLVWYVDMCSNQQWFCLPLSKVFSTYINFRPSLITLRVYISFLKENKS